MRDPIKIVIHLEGGCVTGVACSIAKPDSVQVMVVDHDNDDSLSEEEEAELALISDQCPTWVY